MKSDHTYTVRYGIGTLMNFFLGEYYAPEYPEAVAAVKSNEYYINMMRAWYFATALIGHYDDIVKILETGRLDTFTHNKTISKARESYRITPEKKEYLKTLRK